MEGCNRIVKSQGLCQRHGAKPRTCKVEGCTKQAQGNFDKMCKAHFKDMKRRTTPIPKVENKDVPPPAEGVSVYDAILPQSIAFNATKAATGAVMPLIAHLKHGFDTLKPPAWHRNEERRARGLFPIDNPAAQLEGWERELVWMEILVLTGVPGSSFRQLARAWGRDKGFHMVLAQFICDRHGDVERKKRHGENSSTSAIQRPTMKKRKTSRGNKTTPANVGADVWDPSMYGDVDTNEALAAEIFDFSEKEFERVMSKYKGNGLAGVYAESEAASPSPSVATQAAVTAILGDHNVDGLSMQPSLPDLLSLTRAELPPENCSRHLPPRNNLPSVRIDPQEEHIEQQQQQQDLCPQHVHHSQEQEVFLQHRVRHEVQHDAIHDSITPSSSVTAVIMERRQDGQEGPHHAQAPDSNVPPQSIIQLHQMQHQFPSANDSDVHVPTHIASQLANHVGAYNSLHPGDQTPSQPVVHSAENHPMLATQQQHPGIPATIPGIAPEGELPQLEHTSLLQIHPDYQQVHEQQHQHSQHPYQQYDGTQQQASIPEIPRQQFQQNDYQLYQHQQEPSDTQQLQPHQQQIPQAEYNHHRGTQHYESIPQVVYEQYQQNHDLVQLQPQESQQDRHHDGNRYQHQSLQGDYQHQDGSQLQNPMPHLYRHEDLDQRHLEQQAGQFQQLVSGNAYGSHQEAEDQSGTPHDDYQQRQPTNSPGDNTHVMQHERRGA
jgi:hypothetical protein